MKLVKVTQGKCEFCKKDLEVVEVQLDATRSANLCFKDLQKLARLNLKEPEKAKV